ncbi:MAG: hypothetical protein RLY93_18880 [Sumerlaeia bacterium]
MRFLPIRRENGLSPFVATFFFLCASTLAWSAEMWISQGTLQVPGYPYAFLATTPGGDLLVTTFNEADKPAHVPVLLIRKPTSPNLSVETVTTFLFDSQRGYSGVACQTNGSFFVAGDTGSAGSSFIRKLRPDGTLETAFGNHGHVRPGQRTLGIDVMGDYLLVAFAWGKIGILRASDGAILASLPDAGETVLLRDIAIDPGTLDVWGVAQGEVYRWSDGTPWTPETYTRHLMVRFPGRIRAGEGVSVDPLTKSALVLPAPGNVLASLSADATSSRNLVASAREDSELTDCSLSADGKTLFISDLEGARIHVMQRHGMAPQKTATPSPPHARKAGPFQGSSSPYETKTRWHHSHEGVLELASQYRKPTLLYFRSPNDSECLLFEESVLLTPHFDAVVQGEIMCVFEDVEDNLITAGRLGVFQVPYVILIDASGVQVARFPRAIRPPALFGALESLN